ncbi:ABC transporter permease, partial [Streptomyces triticagri]
MFSLAMRSIGKRPGRFVATLLSSFLGATVIMVFNSLHDTAGASGVDDVSSTSLTTAAAVVGGYGTLLVFFAVASTLTVNVRQREDEIRLLRNTGATPAQIKRMVVGEAAVIGLVGALLAIGPSMLGGSALLDVFQENGEVAGSVDHVFGPIALSSGVSVTLLASIGAAFLAVRRATRAAAGVVSGRGRAKAVFGGLALVLGLGAVSATFAMDATEPALMAAPAYGSILVAVGFAVFSPRMLSGVLGVVERPLSAVFGPSGYLAVHNMRQRAGQLSGVLMPLILFTGLATATLYMQAVENDALKASGLTKSVEDKNMESLNLIVVGIIVAFSCVMLINSLYAATSYRGREFGQQRLSGATPGQVLGMVWFESVLLTVTGVFFGTVAGVVGIVPFTAVRTDAVWPDQGLGTWGAIAGIAVVATVGTMVLTGRRVLREPA